MSSNQLWHDIYGLNLSYIQIRFMPPKKKVTKQEEQIPAETPAKSIDKSAPVESKKQESQPQSQPQPQAPSVKAPAQIPIPPSQSVASKPAQTLISQTIPQITSPLLVSQKSQKIAIDDAAKLSEQQKLRQRKLRFGSIGTEATGQEADKIKQERQKKFGASNEEIEKQLVEKRKQKFATTSAPLAGQPLQTLKKRLEKFGNTSVSAAIVPEDKDLVEERKKKFGNPEVEVNLDQEIKKTKQIHKFPNKNNNNRFQKRQGNNRR